MHSLTTSLVLTSRPSTGISFSCVCVPYLPDWILSWLSPLHAPLHLPHYLEGSLIHSRCSKSACWLWLIVFIHMFCVYFSDYNRLKYKNTCYFLGPQNSPLDTDPILMKGRMSCLVMGRRGKCGGYGGICPPVPDRAPETFSCVQRWGQSCRTACPITPTPCGIKLKEQAYPLSVQYNLRPLQSTARPSGTSTASISLSRWEPSILALSIHFRAVWAKYIYKRKNRHFRMICLKELIWILLIVASKFFGFVESLRDWL